MGGESLKPHSKSGSCLGNWETALLPTLGGPPHQCARQWRCVFPLLFPPAILGQAAHLYPEGLVSGSDPLFSLFSLGESKILGLAPYSLVALVESRCGPIMPFSEACSLSR